MSQGGENVLQTKKRRKAIWIDRLLRRNCLQHVIEGKIEGRIDVMGRRGRRRKELLDGKARMLEIKGGCYRFHSMQNTLWK
jgi:hypothetical protein